METTKIAAPGSTLNQIWSNWRQSDTAFFVGSEPLDVTLNFTLDSNNVDFQSPFRAQVLYPGESGFLIIQDVFSSGGSISVTIPPQTAGSIYIRVNSLSPFPTQIVVTSANDYSNLAQDVPSYNSHLPPNNSVLDHSNNFGGDVTDTSGANDGVDFENGTAIDGGNYETEVDEEVLNGDGSENVVAAGTVTDDHSPGRGTEGSSGSFLDSIGNAFGAIIDGIGDFIGGVFDVVEGVVSGIASVVTSIFSGIASLLNIDPLVLDMDGDGVELVGFDDSHAVFDIDNDGFIENTGWVSKDDAILVHDLNGDGVINNITETISEYYMDPAVLYEDGFSALATLDSNSDGVFDVNDDAHASLLIWQDADEDGETDAGELITLTDAGVQSIDLSKETLTRTELEGNPVISTSTAMVNGVEQAIASVDFVNNEFGYEWNDVAEGLQILTEDGQTSMIQVLDFNGVTLDLSARNSDGDVTNDAGGVIGNIGNDVLIGDDGDNWLIGALGSDILQGGAGNDMLVIDADDEIANIDAGDGFDTIMTVDERGVRVNLTEVDADIGIGGAGQDIFFAGGNTNAFIRGGGGDDIIIGGSADDALSGEDGNDTVDGGLGDDIIRGHRGEDTLIGDTGQDYLDGGLGDDVIYGGTENDLLKGGSGNDRLFGGEGYDVAEFSGNKDDYSITFLGDNSYRIEDNVFGRDGVDIITDVEALNFRDIISLDLAWQNPFTVDDILPISGSGSYTLLAADILANEVDFQNDAVHITDVLEAVGGTAVLEDNGNVTFTPDPDYQGVRSFKYEIADSQGNEGGEVTLSDTGETDEVRGTVYLHEDHHPDDPLFYNQWYLNDINVLPVWQDYTGDGVSVGIFEPGILSRSHIDLIDNIAQETLDNTVFLEDDHATLVSGIIGASQNQIGGTGIAYESTLHGNGSNDPFYDPNNNFDITGIINFDHISEYDIANNSIGSPASFISFTSDSDGPISTFPSTQDGRDGLGTINIWGAGNERQEGRNANDLDVLTFSDIIVVGAINKEADIGSLEVQADPFSNPGANILISAPGSNISSTSLLIENSNGSVFGSDQNVTQGTSFATPIISGVVALMLEANPNLGYRDVQEILAYTARIVNDSDAGWQTNGARNWNGGGLHFSHDYGFGNVDALAAVRLAETWHKQETVNNRITTANPYQSTNLNQAIPDGGTLIDTVEIPSQAPLEYVNVTLDFVHEQVGDLIIKLISPSGTESILLNRLDKSLDDPNDRGHGAEDMVYSFGSRAHMGELSQGTWTLEVTDAVDGSIGTLRSWEITFSAELQGNFEGDIPPANTTYVYTDEYHDQTDPARQILDDGVGSESEDDTLNVAAMSGDININLTPGSISFLNGKSLQITANSIIERVFTGDGNDIILGNDVINLLWGGRGNDNINGGAGNDWIFGKSGIDTLTGGSGGDRFVIQEGDTGEQHIQDFNIVDGDTIVIANYEGLSGFADLTFVQDGADTKFTMPDGQEVILVGILSGQLTEQQFIFDPDFKHLDIKVEEITLTNGDDNQWVNIFTGSLIYGLDGNDIIRGSFGDDVIYGGLGDDILLGSFSDDPDWSNVTEAGGGADVLYGGEGNDQLFGSGMPDTLIGGSGQDFLVGNRGADLIYLDGSGDQASGGEGSDTYIVERHSLTNDGADLVIDFDPAADKIDLRKFSEFRSFDDLTLEVAEVTVGGNPRDIIRVWVSQGDIEQDVQLLDLNDVSVLTEENFIFNTSDPIEPQLDIFTLNEDGQLFFSEGDLLANDGGSNNQIPDFSKILVGPQHGSLISDGNGNYTYTPDENYFGEDRLTYEVVDSEGASATSSVFFNVTPINDAPASLMPDMLARKTGTFFAFTPEFVDPDGDFLGYSVTRQDGSPLPSWLSFDPGTLILSGTLPLQPEELLLRFTASDGTTQTNHDLTLSVTTRPPEAQDDSFDGFEDTVLNGNVLTDNGNGVDSDPDGDTLNVVANSMITTALGGTVELLANGDFTYTPLPDVFGVDSFDYTLEDGNGGTDTGSVTITIPDAPENLVGDANGDGFVGAEDLDALLANWGDTITPAGTGADINGDGVVGTADLNLVIANWGQGTIGGTIPTSNGQEYHGTDGQADNIVAGGGDDTLHYGPDAQWSGGFVAMNAGTPDAPARGARVKIEGGARSFDVFDGGEGEDTLALGEDDTVLFLDDGYSDSPSSTHVPRIAGIEIIEGGAGRNVVDLTSHEFSYDIDVSLYGHGGDDVLWTSAGNDYLNGGAGRDNLHGGTGDDELVGGAGGDRLYGGAGADTFTWLAEDLKGASQKGGVDRVMDFSIKQGDSIDISDVLSGYDPLTDAISDFVQITQTNFRKGATLSIDVDGDGDNFVTVATLYSNLGGQSVEQLEENGNLVLV